MNKITIIGNLTRDPETRTTNSGSNVCTFTVAVDRRFPQNGEKVTDFFRVNAWRQLGETCSKFLAKGKKVAVVGELQAREFTNKDGEQRFSLEISADEIEFLSPRGDASEAGTSAPKSKPATAPSNNESGDDLPF